MTYSNSPLAELTYGPAPAAKSQEKLIESHLPLVRKLAWHVHSRMSSAIEVEDLLQTGMVALVEAAQSYQDRGLGFTNYAKLRVRGAMIDALRKASHVSRSAMTFQKRLRAAEDELSRQLGRSPGEGELAAAMGMDRESFRTAADQARSVDLESMETVYSDQNIWFADPAERADNRAERLQQRDRLAAAIDAQPPREAMILQLYFIEEMNLDEIGQTLNIGAARVCQIKKAALAKLHRQLAPG
ncbi:FliA/WhiG family RNA polymerase sigma factor [Parasphingorhabdus sp.]|uniref:sigma-70 family RNA polymerase sigma factor n=1 Tax=Parasphingorhabdus sp. TaxID=2709688 RepID=UPI002F935FC9